MVESVDEKVLTLNVIFPGDPVKLVGGPRGVLVSIVLWLDRATWSAVTPTLPLIGLRPAGPPGTAVIEESSMTNCPPRIETLPAAWPLPTIPLVSIVLPLETVMAPKLLKPVATNPAPLVTSPPTCGC